MNDNKIPWVEDERYRVEVIRINWVGPSMNTICNSRHWSLYNEAKKVALSICSIDMKGIRPFDTPVRLEFSHTIGKNYAGRQMRLFDCSNYAVTNKAIEDCLVKLGIIKNDNVEFVVGVTTNTPVKGDKSFTTLKIIESAHEA